MNIFWIMRKIEEDIDFLKVILPDIENNSIREDLKDYIDSIS